MDVTQTKLPPDVARDDQELAALLARSRDWADEPSVIPRAKDRETFPLSFAQQRLWLLDRLDPGRSVYNVPLLWRLDGPLDEEALARSVRDLVTRHEVLRACYVMTDGEPRQKAGIADECMLVVQDVESTADAVPPAVVDEAERPFDLERGPLFRATLFRISADERLLLVNLHHAIVDDWSIDVLIRELSAGYVAAVDGRAATLPDLPIQYGDFAVWERSLLTGPARHERLAYWRERLGDLTPVQLPLDRPRPATPSFRGATVERRLPDNLPERLRSVSRARNATVFMTALAAFKALLVRYTGQCDIAVGTPIANRSRLELEPLIGCFVNTLVLRTHVRAWSFARLIEAVRDEAIDAYAHQDTPFDLIVEDLGPDRAAGETPLIPAVFVMQSGGRTPLAFPGVRVTAVARERITAKFDLTFVVSEDDRAWKVTAVYNTDVIDAASAERLVAHYERLLDAMLADPDLPIADARLLDDDERAVLTEWGSGRAAAAPESVVSAFEGQAARQPHATAVACGADAWTYGALNARANQLAHYLRRNGVGPDAVVAVCLERSIGLVQAQLGILKAGGAFLTLDLEHPAARLAYMVADARARCVLTSRQLLPLLNEARGAELLCLDELDAVLAGESTANPGAAVAPQDLAYVIYTSGSTGVPKGVMAHHAGLSNLVEWHRRAYAPAAGDRCSQIAALSFDACVWEIMPPLASGAALHIAPAEARASADALVDYIERDGITHAFLPTPLAEAFLDRCAGSQMEAPSLRVLLTGGDRLRACVGPPRHFRFVNHYGPTEATVVATAGPVEWDDRRAPAIGQPIQNMRAYVLDDALREAPIGVPGELCLGGAGVARGYVSRPDLTAERFVADCINGGGARFYRTGDLVRWRSNGTLEFLGRVDQQIKIRGYRIEPGEIEAVLRRHPGVRDAVVVARSDPPASTYLAAYLTAGADGVDIDACRLALARELPSYMVPARWAVLEALPLTATGKLDRAALPPIGAGPATPHASPPRTPFEDALLEIWADALQRQPASIGVDDDFFDLGGHSLLATKVLARVRHVLGAELSLRAVFERPTIASLAEAVSNSIAPSPGRAPIARQQRASAPLSLAQQRLWILDRLDPANSRYNIPILWRLAGPVDIHALERSVRTIAARHEVLRARYVTSAGGPVQETVPLDAAPIVVLAASEDEQAAIAAADADADRPFDLTRGPLMRATVWRIAADDHLFLLCVHHSVADDVSVGVLVKELSANYAAAVDGRELDAAPLPVQYADYAVWQRDTLASGTLGRELAYWRDQLAGVAPLELPADRHRSRGGPRRAATADRRLSPELGARLRALGRRHDATLFMTTLAAFQTLLHRVTGATDVAVGSPIANRGRVELESLIGFFVNTLVLRTRIDQTATFSRVLAAVREVALGAYAHQEAPFDRVVEELQPAREPGEIPLVSIVFLCEQTPPSPLVLTGIRATRLERAPSAAKFDLTFAVRADGDDLTAYASYDAGLFDGDTITRLLARYERLLDAVVADPDRRVLDVPLSDEVERAQLSVWSGGGAAPRDTVVALVEAQVARQPDAVAVVCGDTRQTYAELNACANRLARWFQRRGLQPETVVGVCLDRRLALAHSLLAILKAGGAYLPLDPDYPRARIGFMIADAGARAVITDGVHRHAIPPDVETICLEDIRDAVDREDSGNLEVPLTVEHLACVLYTSGSTGQPKGALVPHRSIPGYLTTADVDYAGQTFLQHSSISWDPLTLEFWSALVGGGRCVLYPERLLGARAIREAVERYGITLLWLPASLYASIVDEDATALGGVPQLLIGGEALSVPHVRRGLVALPRTRIVNGYGPSECTVFSACHAIPRDLPADARSVPIGKPIGDRRVFVLDAMLRAAPVGVPGELYVSGPAVARGYLARPTLTAERFIADPYATEPGARMYRTGDRVRWQADGTLEFLGRLDQQIKIRGYRIEPGEVEAALRRHEAVRDAAVVARHDPGVGAFLAAYVVTASARTLDVDHLQAALARELPGYMVPLAWTEMERLPLTANGKLDRAALPPAAPLRALRGRAAPRTPIEQALVDIWTEAIQVSPDGVGPDDNFFDLGGHSLLATQVLSRVREVFGVEVPLRRLFERPVLSELAETIQASLAAAAPSTPIRPQPASTLAPLSSAQQRLWFLDRLQPNRSLYNVPVLWRLDGVLDVDALDRSVRALVNRHDVLRARYVTVEAEPHQECLPPVDRSMVISHDCEDEAAAIEAVAVAAAQPFDLARGPLVRADLFRVGTSCHLLLLTLHHSVTDDWSLRVIARELSAMYQAALDGRSADLPPLSIQYGDFAIWQRNTIDGEIGQRELAYWREQLAGVAPVELVGDRRRPAGASGRGGTVERRLAAGIASRLRALSRQQNATVFMTAVAAFQTLLMRYTGQTDVAVGTPIANRSRLELEPLVGFFVNTLVLRTPIRPDWSFHEVVAAVREAALGAYAHQDLPFDRLVEELHPARAGQQTPIVRVMFALQSGAAPALVLPGIRATRLRVEHSTAKADLIVVVGELDGELSVSAEYDADVFDEITVRRMLAHYERLLAAAIDAPDRAVSGLLIADLLEREQLRAWSRAVGPYPDRASIVELFEEQAALRPDADAIVDGVTALSYGELNRRANRLANYLRRRGVGADAVAGVCLERSVDAIVALLAIVKSGSAYLPLDPEYPVERLRLMVRDTNANLVISRAPLAERFAGALPVDIVWLDREADAIESCDDGNASAHVESDDLAYIVYTSGSTGQPKGIAATHRGVVRLVRNTNYVPFGPDLTILQASTLAFDASTFEIWGALLNGGRLAILRRADVLDPHLLARACREARVTTLFLTTALFNECVRAEPSIFKGLRHVLFGGELADHASIGAALASDPPEQLIHVYGPTETVTFASFDVLDDAAADRPVPIGRPISNTTIHVLDQRLGDVPIGAVGEIWIAGPGVARGYVNRPGLTAERFVADPYAAEPGARMYRTGDLGRWSSEGRLEFFGRVDHQVKVRGFRIEPGEIESVLRRQPDVVDAVITTQDHDAGKQLVAYVVAAPGSRPDVAALRAQLDVELPPYMIPSGWAFLERLPLNANGKVDRAALPFVHCEERAAERALPGSAIEETLSQLWTEMLRLDRLGIDDNFFELGGHSLLATQLVSRIRRVFDIELPLQDLFEAPTIRELAKRIAQMGGGAPLPPIPRTARSGALPLSFAQQRLWFLQQLNGGDASYNVVQAIRLQGDLDAAALEHALTEIVRRHEALRTRIEPRDGHPVQVVDPPAPIPLIVVRLSGSAADAQVRAWMRQESSTPFDLTQTPLLRARLLAVGPGEHVLVLALHHIASDGWSIGVLMREISALYDTYAAGARPALPELPIQYADYAVWQRHWLRGELLERELAYWRQQLAGVAPLELPTDRPRPAVQQHRGGSEPVTIARDLTARLEQVSRQAGVTLFMTLLAAWAVLLQRYSGQDEIVVGTPVAGRLREETERLIGFFVNTLPLRVDMRGNPAIGELLARVRQAALGGYAHQQVPFEKLVEELQPARDLSRHPIFQVMFVMQNAPEADFTLPGLHVTAVDLDHHTAKFDLLASVARGADGELAGAIEYNAELYDASTVRRLLTHWGRLLEAFARGMETPVGDIEMFADEERARVLDQWNDTAQPYVREQRIPDLIRAAAARVPDSVAIACDGDAVTYAELMARAGRLGRYLRRLGVTPETCVGLFIDRSIDMIVGMLGILEAGGAYVPLDPEYPRARIEFAAADATLDVIVTREPLAASWPIAGARTVCLDRDAAAINAEPSDPPPAAGTSDNAAYVIYTSGSTGLPKGVVITHRSVNAFLHWCRGEFGDTFDAVAATTSMCFDLSVFEILLPLVTARRIVLLRSSLDLVAPIARERRLLVNTVPSAVKHLQENGVDLAGLAALNMAGEPIPSDVAERLPRGVPVRNLYGPTEDTTYSTCQRIHGDDHHLIGRPIGNRRAYVLDARLRPVPVGVTGELHLAGEGLARGYLKRPSLTADRFIANPYARAAGERLYRTGDQARYRPDGTLEFLGRADGQVKIRGYRIELGEIEVVLARHPGVREVAVLAPGEDRGRQLVAYLVARDRRSPTSSELQKWAKERLPDYMVPARFVELDQMPQTPNGKVDRRALLQLRAAPAAGAGALQTTRLEEALVEIWKGLLDVEAVGLDDNFFDIGGHSLLIAPMARMIEQRLGTPVSAVDLFRYPSISALATFLSERSGSAASAEMNELQARATRRAEYLGARQPVKAHD